MENIILNITESTNNIKKIVNNLENNNNLSKSEQRNLLKSEQQNLLSNLEIYFTNLSNIHKSLNNNEITPTQNLLNAILTNINYFFSNKISLGWYTYLEFDKVRELFNIMITKYNLKFNENFIILYNNCWKDNNSFDFKNILSDYILKTKKFTELETLLIIKNMTNFIFEYFYENNNLYKLFFISDSTIKEAFKKNHMLNFIKFIKKENNIQFNNEHLDISIENGTHDLYLFLSNEENITITQKHLENAFLYFKNVEFNCSNCFNNIAPNMKYEECNICTTIITDIFNKKIIPSSICLKNLLSTNHTQYYYHMQNSQDYKKNTNAALLLLNMGLKITQEDFELLTKNCIEINNYKKYDVVINDKIINLCNETGFFPYSIKPSNYGLLCTIQNNIPIFEIKKIIKTYNLVPNIECLREACKKENLDLIKYLSSNLNFDLICLKNSIMMYFDERKAHKRAMYFFNLIANTENNIINKHTENNKNIIINEEILKNFNKIMSINQLKKLTLKYNFIPNIDCLKKLSEIKFERSNNINKYIELVDFIIKEYKINIDYECFKNSIKTLHNKQITYIMEKIDTLY
jgi:hypothetical protein